jgi:hypothetical protein
MKSEFSSTWLASLIALASLDSLSAQTPRPAVPNALDLAKYDRNKNGTLEADELAALQADEAKLARSVVAAPQSTIVGPVVTMSPFEVAEGNPKACGVAIKIDAGNGIAQSIERFQVPLEPRTGMDYSGT